MMLYLVDIKMEEGSKFPYTNLSDDPDIAIFERKIRDNLYELNNKRSLLGILTVKIHEITLEKHETERILDKTKRELAEAKIQLDMALKVARKGDSERATSRDAVARQTVQIDVTVKERDMLQERLRLMEVENVRLQQQLEQSDLQGKTYSSFQETCRIKQTQCHSAIEALAKQLSNLEQDHLKLKRMTSGVVEMGKKAIHQISLQKSILLETLEERNSLRVKVSSLTGELDKLKSDLVKKEKTDDSHQCTYFLEWTSAQEDMFNRNKAMDEEFLKLQNVFDSNLISLNRSQVIQKEMEAKIMNLENDLKKLTNKTKTTAVSKCVQTEMTEEHIFHTNNSEMANVND